MKAITYTEFGGPEVLKITEAPVPEPGPGQVRIEVRAVGINPYDWKVRSGAYGGKLPQQTGLEAAGIVAALGEGVSDVAVGDRVFGFATGGAAEQAILREYAPMPAILDFAHAAALPVAVETATRTLDILGVDAGTTLLINGASGAVGQAAVQLATARGASVIGTAGAARQDLVRSLGAEPVVYGNGLPERVRALHADGVDAALDAAGGGALPDLVALAGGPARVVTIADYAGAEATGARFSGGMGDERRPEAIRIVLPLIEAGQFALPVARTFPLTEIAAAHELSQAGGSGGKLVLTVG